LKYIEASPSSRTEEACLREPAPNSVTQLLNRWTRGEERALHELVPIVYQELRRLADLLADQGHPAEAEKLYRQILAIRTRTLGPEHPDTLQCQISLAQLLLKEGRLQEAEKMQRQTLAVNLRVIGAESPQTLWCQSDLAETLIKEGHYSEAEKIASAALAIERRTMAPTHPETLYTLQRLGLAITYRRRCGDTAPLFREIIEKAGYSAPQDKRVSVWYSYRCVAAAANRADDAVQYLQEAVNRGYKDADGLLHDDEIKTLHTSPKFQQLLAALRQPAVGNRPHQLQLH
jgi:tetratricopeptide (TPR) repeat protein